MRYGQDDQALLRCLSGIDVILSEQEGDDCGNCRRNQERADKCFEEAMNHLKEAMSQKHRARSAGRLAGKTEEKRQKVLAENKRLRQQRNEARAEVRLLKKAIQSQGGVK
jgi:hypothetical protein